MNPTREQIEAILAEDVKLLAERTNRLRAELALDDARKLCMVYDSLLKGESADRKVAGDELDDMSDEDLMKRFKALQESLGRKR